MDKNYVTYREIRKTIPREDVYDMVAFGVLTPIAVTNTAQSWKFHKSDVTEDLIERLNKVREMKNQTFENYLLASQIEYEWSKTSKGVCCG